MLKSFWSAPNDGVTPKASAQDKNPFDSLNSSRPIAGSRKNSLIAQPPAASGTSTPPPPTPSGSSKSFGLPFFAGSSSGSARSSNGSSSGSQARSFTTGDDLATPGPSTTNPQAAAASIGLTKAEPDFTLQNDSSLLAKRRAAQQPSALAKTTSSIHSSSPPAVSTPITSAPPSGANTPNPAAPKGKLSVKVISARNLAVQSDSARPYIVAAYDQNEFVGREAVMDDSVAPITSYAGVKGAQTPMSTSPPKPTAIINNSNSMSVGGKEGAQSALARSLEAHRNGSLGHSNGGQQHQKQNSSNSSLSFGSAHNPVWKQEVIFDVVSDSPNQIRISIYDRAHDEGFLGAVDISPRLSVSSTVDTWIKLQARGDEKVTGEIRLQYRYEKLDGKKSLSVKDFDFLRMIGKGTFGRVFQVRKKDTKRIYAMKVLSKKEIVAKKEVAHTIGERKILQRSSECPFLLGLKFSFQNATELYLVMDYKSGGELFHHLQQEGRFTEDRARFYTAEIVLAFEHLHKYDIVYRDLKPENILLDATGHIVLCDFGLSKPDLPSDALTNTFCGTTEYLAPEVLLDDHGYSKLVDFWSLGVLLFEMCCGWSPFYAEDTQQMYKNICFGKIKFPRGVIGDDGKQFVKGLLNRNPRHRLGAHRDAEELKEHAFFSQVDWTALAAREITPPFMPFVESDESVANFDAEFTSVKIQDAAPRAAVFDDSDTSSDWINHASVSNSAGVPIGKGRQESHPLSHSVQDAFQGFSYAGSVMDDRPSWTAQYTADPSRMSEDEQD